MKSRLKMTVGDWFLIGACTGYASTQSASYWLSWRRVVRELRHLNVGTL